MSSFSHYPIPEQLIRSLEKMGFTAPKPIQEQALPLLLNGNDLIACSETGSGKTAAFMIPMLSSLMSDPTKAGLVLVPTRELADQVFQFVEDLVKESPDIHVVRLVGGADIRKQFKKLQRKPRLVVATPGRLIDHLKRNTLQIHKTEHLVLDEGDRMIDMGFLPQLKQILQYLPEERQTSFFTATLDGKVKDLARQYLHNPKQIIIGKASRPVASIRQSVVQVNIEDKDECLATELNLRPGSVIVFFKTQRRTSKVCGFLKDYGFSVDQIHGGRTQGQRNKAIQNFKSGKIRILCATDVASRGIDVPQIEHVINMDLPMAPDDYVHRIGRTARNGAGGEALSFVTPQETRAWNALVKRYNILDALLPEKQNSKPRNNDQTKHRNKNSNNQKSAPASKAKPGRNAKPDRTAKPDRNARPDRSAKSPSKAAKSAHKGKPTHGPKSASNGKSPEAKGGGKPQRPKWVPRKKSAKKRTHQRTSW